MLFGASRTLEAGWEFPSWPDTVVQVCFMLGVLAITVAGFRLETGRIPTPTDVGLGPPTHGSRLSTKHLSAPVVALLAILLVAALVAVLSRAEPEADLGLLLVTVVVRWPVSVLAQQTLFFGWLQPRLGRRGVAYAALLYSAFHVANPLLMLMVVPLGFLFALMRRRTGSVRAGLVAHYVGNVVFVVVLGSG
jgi:membrane protease YdiL (CAAX protease family)